MDFGILEQQQFGNLFGETSDSDGLVSFVFDGIGTDLTLDFLGYDVDFSNEIDVRLNGASLGFLSEGLNDDVVGYQIDLDAAEQVAGRNEIEFVQLRNPSWKWGVTDLSLVQVDHGSVVEGTSAEDVVIGGGGADLLNGAQGNDTITGGDGADIFVFFSGDGDDIVTDFEPSLDIIRFETVTTLIFADLSISAVSGDTRVDYGSGTILLQGIDASVLGDDDFEFV